MDDYGTRSAHLWDESLTTKIIANVIREQRQVLRKWINDIRWQKKRIIQVKTVKAEAASSTTVAPAFTLP